MHELRLFIASLREYQRWKIFLRELSKDHQYQQGGGLRKKGYMVEAIRKGSVADKYFKIFIIDFIFVIFFMAILIGTIWIKFN